MLIWNPITQWRMLLPFNTVYIYVVLSTVTVPFSGYTFLKLYLCQTIPLTGCISDRLYLWQTVSLTDYTFARLYFWQTVSLADYTFDRIYLKTIYSPQILTFFFFNRNIKWEIAATMRSQKEGPFSSMRAQKQRPEIREGEVTLDNTVLFRASVQDHGQRAPALSRGS